MEYFLHEKNGDGISLEEQKEAIENLLLGRTVNKVLIIPPDFTRYHSGSGYLVKCCYETLKDRAVVDILPALGTHTPMSDEEISLMYPDIPRERFIEHDWRGGVTKIGEISGTEMNALSDGIWTESVEVEVSSILINGGYDLILSVGQVVPHEVIGMSNHAKNIFVGVGGSSMINSSHMLGALYGLERIMGRDYTPVRKLFDTALQRFLSDYPIIFVLTTMSAGMHMHGLFVGDTRKVLEKAVESSQEHNIDWLDEPIKKCVVYLDPNEYKSTWLGNKAVYRTRMAIADGGELIVIAPGIEKFGEDSENDRIIRKFGYCGRLKILELFKSEPELKNNMGAAAHLIHGSADGRFSIKYAVKKISKDEINAVGFQALDYDEITKIYDPDILKDGYNTMPDGERIFYISNPALGLWAECSRFEKGETDL